MSDVAEFDILLKFSHQYMERRSDPPASTETAMLKAAGQAFYNTLIRMQRTVLRPLDLLPPVDVTFRDYAMAVLRAEELSNPEDLYGYYKLKCRAKYSTIAAWYYSSNSKANVCSLLGVQSGNKATVKATAKVLGMYCGMNAENGLTNHQKLKPSYRPNAPILKLFQMLT